MEENINLHQAKVFGIGGNDEPSQNFPKYDIDLKSTLRIKFDV